MTTPKLTDIQILLLTTAASRDDGSVLPPPPEVGARMPRIRSAIVALLKQALIEEVAVTETISMWREEGGLRLGLIITTDGRAAIGIKEPVQAETIALVAPTKIGKVVELMRREGGATLTELVEATGWLPHTTRAALTGLRKKGHAIGKTDRDGFTAYVLAA